MARREERGTAGASGITACSAAPQRLRGRLLRSQACLHVQYLPSLPHSLSRAPFRGKHDAMRSGAGLPKAGQGRVVQQQQAALS